MSKKSKQLDTEESLERVIKDFDAGILSKDDYALVTRIIELGNRLHERQIHIRWLALRAPGETEDARRTTAEWAYGLGARMPESEWP